MCHEIDAPCKSIHQLHWNNSHEWASSKSENGCKEQKPAELHSGKRMRWMVKPVNAWEMRGMWTGEEYKGRMRYIQYIFSNRQRRMKTLGVQEMRGWCEKLKAREMLRWSNERWNDERRRWVWFKKNGLEVGRWMGSCPRLFVWIHAGLQETTTEYLHNH